MNQVTSDAPTLTAIRARQWLDRWDAQQERYVPDRDERFAVIADVVAAVVAERTDPLVVDLGAGPASLSISLLDRLPNATLVAVDADPLLLGLARTAHADRPGLRLIERDLRDGDWVLAAGLADGSVDAIVTTTALHWLTSSELERLYGVCGRLLRPGGVFVDGDHLFQPQSRTALRRLERVVRDARIGRVGTGENEDWEAWWRAVASAPELRTLTGARGARPVEHHVPEPPTLDDHQHFLRAAGFVETGTVWQHGDDRVLVGIR